ncbi:hypothetical protein VTH06DRAFT_4477 [Thermothelomyces fergusii]
MSSDSRSQHCRDSRSSHSSKSEGHAEQSRTHLQPSPELRRLGQDPPSAFDTPARAVSQADIFTPATGARSYGPPVIVEGPYLRVPEIFPPAPHERSDWSASMNPAMANDFRDELARLDGVITPGVDNTPYIHYAIEALCRGRDSGSPATNFGSQSPSPGPVSALPGGHGPQGHGPQLPPQRQPLPPSTPLSSHPPDVHPHAETAPPETRPQPLPRPFVPGPQESAHSLAESLLKKGSRPPQPHEWRPVEQDELLVAGPRVPLPTFRPWPLRTPALVVFMLLCLLMVAALILSALVAAPMLLYAQFLVTTMSRMMPFVRLASKSAEEREGALFQELYPSFLWPRFVGPWNFWVPVLVTWLANFTIPLQSSLFTVILVEGRWVWATVQGVAWTLVALYLALLASAAVAWRYWSGLESTGVLWDPRSLADIAALVSETNTADDYRGTQLARSRDGIRFALRHRATDRLCYWTWKDGRHGLWHTLGSSMEEADPLLHMADPTTAQRMQRHDEKHADHDDPYQHNQDPEAPNGGPRRHHCRYLPVPLRTPPLLLATITATALVVAIFVVTFLPSTRLEKGFPPRLRTAPRGGAFSPADFFFAFLPSLLGMFVFLAYQTFDKHLRVLQPWAAMSCLSESESTPSSSTTTTATATNQPTFSGAPAEASILADYAACAPGQATARALRNGHWRVAAVSLLADLFVLIPVLAGGCFMAVTPRGRDGEDEWGEVRMFANQVAYGILLGLLVLYVAGLAVLLPARRPLRIAPPRHLPGRGGRVPGQPRDPGGAAFKRCVSRRELAARLGGAAQTRWVFGFADADGGSGELGVRRVRRFTEKRRVRKSQIGRAFL